MYLYAEHGKEFEEDIHEAKESLRNKAAEIREAMKRDNKVKNGNG